MNNAMDGQRTQAAMRLYFTAKLANAQRSMEELVSATLQVSGLDEAAKIKQICMEKVSQLETKVKYLDVVFTEERQAEQELKESYEQYQAAVVEKLKVANGESNVAEISESFSSMNTGDSGQEPSGNANGSVAVPASITSERTRNETQIGEVMIISEAEFQEVPKYMKGRATVGQVNVILEKLNGILEKKYQILATGIRGIANMGIKNEFYKYRDQESTYKDQEGGRFCSEGDLRDVLTPTEAAFLKKAIPIMRHCKRVKDVRCGKDTFLCALME